MQFKSCTSLVMRIGHSDLNAWDLAGDYLQSHVSREAALAAAVAHLANGDLPDMIICDGLSFPAKEVLFFISNRPVYRSEPNV